MLAHEVLVQGLVEGHHLGHRFVQQADQVRERVPEKAADADGHVDARAAQFGQGDDLHPQQAAVFPLPDGPHAHQGQHLGHIIPVRAHVAGAPHADGHTFRVRARLAAVAFDNLPRQLLAHLPRGHRRHGTRVHRVEVAAGRQDVRVPPRRRAAGARRHKTALQSRQQVGNFVFRLAQNGDKVGADEVQDGTEPLDGGGIGRLEIRD